MMAENRDFEMVTKQFEGEIFKHIPLVQQLDSVHQNVVRYKILMENYLKYLPQESEERQEAIKAIEKLGNVSNKVNESVADNEASKILVELHRRLQGRIDVFKPGRKLLMEGNIMKQSRKESQARFLILFTDLLLICKETLGSDIFDSRSYQIPMERVKIVNEEHDEFENMFQVKSPVKSFSFIAKNKHERDKWVNKLREAKLTTKKRNPKPKLIVAEDEDDDDFLPLWIPDRDATKCLMETCTTIFSVVKRRHHCRACGYLICGNCVGKAPIKKRGFSKEKVCPQCFYEIIGEYSSGSLFPESMLHREVGTDGRSRAFAKYGEGANMKLVDASKLFAAPKSGQLRKVPLPSHHRVCGKVHVRVGKGEQTKWAALTDGMVLQFFNAQLVSQSSSWLQCASSIIIFIKLK
uniref:Uncharacterized protein n=1 Tax=Plectus sambesii TaxID=2011161 RepID=A0A914XBX5_9BILA